MAKMLSTQEMNALLEQFKDESLNANQSGNPQRDAHQTQDNQNLIAFIQGKLLGGFRFPSNKADENAAPTTQNTLSDISLPNTETDLDIPIPPQLAAPNPPAPVPQSVPEVERKRVPSR